MTKEERKAIKVLVDLGQSFQTADRDPEYIVKYTLKSGHTYSGQAISEIIMRILNLIKKQEKENTDFKDIIREKLNKIKTDKNYPKFADYEWSNIEHELFWKADVLEELLEELLEEHK